MASDEELDIVIEAQVKHTESKDKVAKAISNLFKDSGELRVEKDRVMFVSQQLNSLNFIKEQFRDRRVRSAVRRLLLSSQRELEATLLLNKQAATVGIAAVCDDPSQSPLGPIVLRIRSSRLEQVIDWLTAGYERAPETS